ncbi:MAG: MarR family transcriptional regulator [Candidatus Thermoplasmatota archaeon]|nr:MarR family transcriptional regulator [Candidatus Thermoplasmatota archaeon]
MAVVFGTLGYRPKSLIPTLRSTEGVDKLVFYYGADKADPEAGKKVLEARKTVVDYCAKMGIAVDPVELSDPFDFKGIASRIRKDLRRHKAEGKEIAVFNIAGGTRPTSSAALLVCILEGVPTVYIHDVTYDEIRLPLLKMEYDKVLSKEEKEILRFLSKDGGAGMTEVELAAGLGKHKATMNHHVKNLVRKGAVRLDRHPTDQRKKLVRVEDSTELLLGDDL